MWGFDVESPIQIQCTIMRGSDSCLERCRALNKLHRNFPARVSLARALTFGTTFATHDPPRPARWQLQPLHFPFSVYPPSCPHAGPSGLPIRWLPSYPGFQRRPNRLGTVILGLNFSNPKGIFLILPGALGSTGTSHTRVTGALDLSGLHWASGWVGTAVRGSGPASSASAAQSPAHKLAVLSLRLQREASVPARPARTHYREDSDRILNSLILN